MSFVVYIFWGHPSQDAPSWTFWLLSVTSGRNDLHFFSTILISEENARDYCLYILRRHVEIPKKGQEDPVGGTWGSREKYMKIPHAKHEDLDPAEEVKYWPDHLSLQVIGFIDKKNFSTHMLVRFKRCLKLCGASCCENLNKYGLVGSPFIFTSLPRKSSFV